MSRCSIVIPVYNNSEVTRRCLDALFALPEEGVPFQVVVVDDGSTDRTGEVLAAYGERITAIRSETNRGYASACNTGAREHTAAPYLVFLNNDTIPYAGWLRALVGYADTHADVAVIGAKLLDLHGRIQHAGVVICQDLFPRHLYAGFPADHPAVNKSRPFQIVTAACTLIHRRWFERMDGFDTTYCNGYEDVDLCLRIGLVGGKIHYCHESVLQHIGSATRADRKAEFLENERLYLERWQSIVRPDDLAFYVADELLTIRYSRQYPMTLAVSSELALWDDRRLKPSS